jgi:hypothetical protein
MSSQKDSVVFQEVTIGGNPIGEKLTLLHIQKAA